jgi:outer membrane cobalamin receptor
MRRFQLLLVSCFAVLGLAGCGNPQASISETSNVAQAVTNPAAGFTSLKDVTEKTATAIKSGKLDDAKATFGKFEDSWKIVEDGVKAKSSKTYDAVEESLDMVNRELKNKQPEKTKLLDALQSLSQTIAIAAKS